MLDRIQVGVHERGAHSGPLSYGPPPESYQAYMGRTSYWLILVPEFLARKNN